jgi:hypothetical protein
MLINCPRCGFSQPKDQYCASCGVNIETYVPRKESLWSKIFSNTLLQVTIVIIIALGVSYYTMKAKDSSSPQSSRRKTFQQSINNSSLSHMTSVQKSELAEDRLNIDNSATNYDTIKVELQNEAQRDRLAGKASIDESSEDSFSNETSTTTAAAVATKSLSVPIKLSYYEINRSILDFWVRNSQIAPSEDVVFSAGLIDRKLFDNQIQYTALKSEATNAVINNKTTFRSDAQKNDISIGLISEIIMSSSTNGSLTITKTTSQNVERIRSYIHLYPGRIFFIHWKNDLVGLQNESILADVSPFQIFKSNQFMMGNGTTELVMIIESTD